ncbi:hypothetical protein ACN38_g6467 [Penicillium nordicum]|uniref:Uncharacterized protein n=1 Tax=Penicillium nordicum TaxID=229535 RepID=A0A0M9WF91_9EURO|nr:hypothetical protein ACN38_g6467 [Penicillium nordicum]
MPLRQHSTTAPSPPKDPGVFSFHVTQDTLGVDLIFLPGAAAAVFQPFFGFLSDRFGRRVITFALPFYRPESNLSWFC